MWILIRKSCVVPVTVFALKAHEVRVHMVLLSQVQNMLKLKTQLEPERNGENEKSRLADGGANQQKKANGVQSAATNIRKENGNREIAVAGRPKTVQKGTEKTDQKTRPDVYYIKSNETDSEFADSFWSYVLAPELQAFQ